MALACVKASIVLRTQANEVYKYSGNVLLSFQRKLESSFHGFSGFPFSRE